MKGAKAKGPAEGWAAGIEVSAEEAAALIRGCFPEVSAERVALLGRGLDNHAFLTQCDKVFRFPRRAASSKLLEHEARVLPKLAPRMPVAVPDSKFVGHPVEDFPWLFVGYAYIPGRTACQLHLSEGERRALAPALARFLCALHSVDPRAVDAPADEIDRRNVARRLPLVVERLAALESGGVVPDQSPWLRLFRDLEGAEAPKKDTLVHGDLYASHLLLDDERRLVGVIDWGDVHAGDIAMDLMMVYGFLPATARADFFEEYGVADERALRTARLRAASHAVSLAWHGMEVGDDDLLEEGRLALHYVLDG